MNKKIKCSMFTALGSILFVLLFFLILGQFNSNTYSVSNVICDDSNFKLEVEPIKSTKKTNIDIASKKNGKISYSNIKYKSNGNKSTIKGLMSEVAVGSTVEIYRIPLFNKITKIDLLTKLETKNNLNPKIKHDTSSKEGTLSFNVYSIGGISNHEPVLLKDNSIGFKVTEDCYVMPDKISCKVLSDSDKKKLCKEDCIGKYSDGKIAFNTTKKISTSDIEKLEKKLLLAYTGRN